MNEARIKTCTRDPRLRVRGHCPRAAKRLGMDSFSISPRQSTATSRSCSSNCFASTKCRTGSSRSSNMPSEPTETSDSIITPTNDLWPITRRRSNLGLRDKPRQADGFPAKSAAGGRPPGRHAAPQPRKTHARGAEAPNRRTPLGGRDRGGRAVHHPRRVACYGTTRLFRLRGVMHMLNSSPGYIVPCAARLYPILLCLLVAASGHAADAPPSNSPRKYQFDGTISTAGAGELSVALDFGGGRVQRPGRSGRQHSHAQEPRRKVCRAKPLPVGRREQFPGQSRAGQKQVAQGPCRRSGDGPGSLRIRDRRSARRARLPCPIGSLPPSASRWRKRNFRLRGHHLSPRAAPGHRATRAGPGRKPAGNADVVLLSGGVVHRHRSSKPSTSGKWRS